MKTLEWIISRRGVFYKYLIINLLIFLIITTFFHPAQCQKESVLRNEIQFIESDSITVGAERTESYFDLLKGKSIGIVCNHTSMAGNVHLLDTLVSAGFAVKVVFTPEHGFRGGKEAGAAIDDETDSKTGVRIISLYGNKKKPVQEDLSGINVLLFDIQDVGVRFYTYISTLTYVMEAAADIGIPVIVTDRPNPNGFYIDGPVLDTNFKSFVGLHPVPVVYGMTIGEYAMMANEEGWIGDKKCNLTVIPMSGYNHRMLVSLPVRPSPNLPCWQAVYLYPSLCFFEGTIISVGRGTEFPFQVFGHPGYLIGSYAFIPKKIPGVAEKPPYENEECFGGNVTGFAEDYATHEQHLCLFWLISAYNFFKDSENFFTPYFDKLAGTDRLRLDIQSGKSEDEIRKGWETDLSAFKKIRSKYLLYP
jgi:uncharacterized protein YbbC (DUF1343 family)